MLSLNQRRAVVIIAIIGFFLMIIAFIHILFALFQYERRANFLQVSLIGFICMAAAAMLIDSDRRKGGSFMM